MAWALASAVISSPIKATSSPPPADGTFPMPFKMPSSCRTQSNSITTPPILGKKQSPKQGYHTPLKVGSAFQALLACAPIMVCAFIASLLPCAAAAGGTSININPVTGDDSLCGVAPDKNISCKTVARAVELNIASILIMSAGTYNEPPITISNVASLAIVGVPSATVFDCSSRLGEAFYIVNSTVTITGVTFQDCRNPSGHGGAVSAIGSSIVVSQCSFTRCSAASGGAISATGPDKGLFLSIQNSTFRDNTAHGMQEDCPSTPTQWPCSTWGGAIAAFEMLNVAVSGCDFSKNQAEAYVPQDVNAISSVAGGGCVSILFRRNATGSRVRISDNQCLECNVYVFDPIYRGNGYGGAVSVYFGLSAELQLLHVSSFDLVLENNAVTNCGAFVYTKAGNAYGGGISVYMGGYSSVLSLSGNAMAAVGATDVRNVSVVMHKARFTSCRATRTNAGNLYGANTYGGSFSFYIGAYAWSQSWSALGISQSKCGPTTASELSVQVGDARCSRCIANVSTGGGSNGTMSVGGSLNAMYVGAYAWSNSQFSTSRSECAATTASRLRVQVSDAGCTNCNASVTSTDGLYSSASYGGFISAIYVGAHAVSFGFGDSYTTPTTSTSICQSTDVSSLSVSVRNVSCRDCSAFSAQLTSSASHLTGANVYGGFLSAMYIGAFSWSTCRSSNSSSTCAATVATNLSVQVSNAPCYNCRAFTLSESLGVHVGVNIFGGSLNALSIGARTYSIVLFGANIRSNFVFFPKSICESTIASNVAVVVSNAPCFSCSVSATAGGFFRGSANVFGGSMNVMFVGSFAWSYNVAQLSRTIVSSCGATTANNIAVGVSNASCHETCEAFVLSRNGNPFGVYAYGGSISALHVGSRAWSFDLSAFNLRDGRTTCEPTSASNLSVAVSDTRCRNCRCAVVLVGETYVANTIGGSISALYVGALAWSYSALSVIKSECQGIDAKDLNVHVSNMSCVNCSAYTYSGFSSFDSNAVGGALSAIYVADSAWGRGGNSNSGSSSITGPSYVQNSHIAVISSRFDSCNAGSYTFGTGSRISPLAWGGAIAMYIAAEKAGNTDSSNLTVVIMHSNFSQCKVVAFSTQAPKAQVSLNGGGAVFAIIPSLSKITVKNSTFKSSESQVLVGNSDSYPAKLNILLNILDAKGEPIDIAETVDTGATFSAGGALAIAALALFDSSLVEIESCTFINCTAQGANAGNLAVRGGAVAVDGVSAVTVKKSIFINCQILDASRNSTIGAIVSGGAGMSVGFVRDINIQHCTFNATNGRDSSGSSTGLLVLAPLSTRLHIKDCQFVSNETVFRFACVDGDGIRSFRCDLLDPSFVSVTDSNVRQTRSKDQQQLISFGKGVQASFTNFSMACLPNFTVFKDLSENEANIEYSCGTCPLFNISLTGSKVFLENLSSSDQMKCNSASKEVKLKCPLGISDCTTFVSVTSGFWTTFANFSNASSLETDRCPAGYCGCQSSPSCPLDPPLTADARQDQLCSGNRTGRLCGGCRPGFTHSGDDKTCIPNEECMKNLWWVWTLSILGYACFGLYIAVSCGEFGENSISCVLFYLQVSSFAANLDESNGSNAILEFALVRSLVTFSSACYAPSLGAYSATAAKLIGPLFVLFFSMAWTWFLQAFQSRLQQRDIRLHVTYSGTLTASVLFCFSSVAKVVFTLVECTSYNNNGVVFIDGTVSCYDANWKALMFIVVLLCLFPVVFAAALWLNKLPEDARAVICRNFTEPVFYWGAVTLSFRLMISLLQFLQVVLPNLLALIRMILSTAMLIMLVHLRPHVLVQTFWVDVVCYVCLIAQFGVQTMFADREYLAVAELEEQKTFFRAMSKLSSAFRYLPVAVLAVTWLKNKIYIASAIKAAGRRIVALARRTKRRFARAQHLPDTYELRATVHLDANSPPTSDPAIRFNRSMTTT